MIPVCMVYAGCAGFILGLGVASILLHAMRNK